MWICESLRIQREITAPRASFVKLLQFRERGAVVSGPKPVTLVAASGRAYHFVAVSADRDPNYSTRAAFSIVGLCAGWAVCSIVFFPQFADPGEGRAVVEDFALTTLLTLVLATPIWLLAMLPASLGIRRSSALCRALIAPGFGAACGALAVLFELSVFDTPSAPGWARLYSGGALAGCCAWGLFALLLRRSAAGEARTP